MPINLKSKHEIEMMRRTGRIGFEILQKMKEATVAGVTTQSLDDLAAAELAKAGAKGMSKNYPTYRPGEGFPGHTCISVNEEVVHGVPGKRVLKVGDLVTLDLALQHQGYCCDMAITVPIGPISARNQKLLDVTRATLDLAIEYMKPGKKWMEIARLMQHKVEQANFSVVREFVGHGVGRTMHEDPKVPNFVTAEHSRQDFTLRPGMTIAVEPMVVAGRRDVTLLADGWTVITEDRQPAAHFEHTIAVTASGIDILSDGNMPVALATTGS